MEHPCHQCQASVEEGVPFCPRCGAPQIRVTAPEGNEPVSPPMPPGTPGNLQPPAVPVYPTYTAPNQIQWRTAMLPAAICGLASGLLMFVPYITTLFFVWMFLAGLVSVMMYRNRTGSQVSLFMGAKIGAVAGFFSFLVVGAGWILAVLTQPDKLHEALAQAATQTAARSTDPQQTKAMQDLFARISSPQGMPIFLAVVLLFLFGFLVILCAVGGAAGSTLGRKNRPVS